MNIVFLTYLIFYLFAPTNYTMTAHLEGAGSIFQTVMYLIPFLVLIPAGFRRIAYILSPLTRQYWLWITICIAGMLMGVIGNTFDMVAWFFSWKTFGFMFASTLFCMSVAKNAFSVKGDYFWYSVGSIWTFIGLTEIINNAEMLWFHGYWQEPIYNFITQGFSDFMWLCAGVLVIVLFAMKYQLRVSKMFWIIFITGFVTYGIISFFQYPVGIYYIKGVGPYYQDLNYWFWFLSHLIRVWYLLPAFLILPQTTKVR